MLPWTLRAGGSCAVPATREDRGRPPSRWRLSLKSWVAAPPTQPLIGPTLAAELLRLAEVPAAGSEQTVALRSDLSAPAICAAQTSGGHDAVVAIDAAGSSTALVLLPVAGGYQVAEISLDGFADSAVDLTRTFLAGRLPAGPVAALNGQQRLLTDDDLRRWTALGLALSSADLVGVMQGAIRLSCDYVATRRQFGVAIGSFQAVQHLLADAQVAMEGSRSVALHAAWAVDALPADEALAAASVAKAYCARAARAVCETSIQVHGGIGNTWECFAHVYLRRALASGDLLGGVGKSLARVLAHHQIGASNG